MKNTMLTFATVAAVGAAIAVSNGAQAQDLEPVEWKATTVSKSVAAGGVATIKLSAEIEDGWHIYSVTQPAGGPQPTKITVIKDQPYTIKGKITTAKAPVVKFDENFNMNVEYHTAKSEFTVPLEVASTVKPGATEAEIAVRYQACDESVCLPPKTVKLKVPLTVTAK